MPPSHAASPAALFIMPWSPDQPAGVSVVVRNLAAEFERTGRRALFGIDDWCARRPLMERGGVLRHCFGVLGGTGLLALAKSAIVAPTRLLRTRRLLNEHGVSAVNFHYPGRNALGVALLKHMGLYRGTLAVSFHGTDVRAPTGLVDRLVWRLIFNACDGITACAPALAARVASTYGLPLSRVSVIYNGANVGVFHPEAARPQGLQLPAAYLVSVGGYIPRKGHRMLLQAFAQIAGRFPALSLVIAGMDGPERAQLVELGTELGIMDRVQCVVDAPQNEVAGIVANAVACVQSARAESFPLAVLEAGACGVPVVATRIDGHTDMLRDGSTAHLYTVDDADACAAAIEKLLADLPGSRAMALRFHSEVVTRYTWPATAEGYARALGISVHGSDSPEAAAEPVTVS